MSPVRWRAVLAEGLGTLLLVAAVVGSGTAAQRLSPDDTGVQLLQNSIATGTALVALILALHPVSAAFNPIVTAIAWRRRLVDTRTAVASITAQFCGGVLGAVSANVMFGGSAVSIATTTRGGPGLWFAEVIATAGLVVVIAGAEQSRRVEPLALAVGGYITAAYWFTSSTSFANPAVTVARMFSDSFAGIAPGSAPVFLLAQAVGGVVGFLLSRALFAGPALTASTEGDPREH